MSFWYRLPFFEACLLFSWNWFKFPEGLPQEIGSAMQAYIAKKENRDQLLETIQGHWQRLSKP
ncbi:MAG TPA: hypothetical protein VMS09_03830 [Paenibacillus sp.]|uniref:hypothetical protein n=1 Tax=Paenibacillus sp. TaxID=58172 RepID=UPI0028D5A9F7|nr:hypothetical protein [Paenibacillus sp.]HUC91144.1 hypothetical protein [Paenibacillus sp.]